MPDRYGARKLDLIDMKNFEKTIFYKEFTIFLKKEPAHWRAKSQNYLKIQGEEKSISIDMIGDNENEVIQKAKKPN